MAKKNEIKFEDFLLELDPETYALVNQLHDLFMEKGCMVRLEAAKSGYVVSYVYEPTNRVVANYVTRKSGILLRLYADNLPSYEEVLPTLSPALQKLLEKASVCRRLLDPAKCNARCPMGYVYTLDGTEHKKCRYSAFMLPMKEENFPHIRTLVEKELAARTA